jgi:hypothetical protein
MILLLLALWTVYIGLGIAWLNYLVQKNYLLEHNVIASLIILMIWPIHMIYTKIKK